MRAASITIYGSTIHFYCANPMLAYIQHRRSASNIEYFLLFKSFFFVGLALDVNIVPSFYLSVDVCATSDVLSTHSAQNKNDNKISLFAHIIIIIIGLAQRVYMYFVKFCNYYIWEAGLLEWDVGTL